MKHDPRGEARLARVASLVADPARSRMLAYLLDGHYASAGELAQCAGVGAPTASAHLSKLAAAGLVVAETRGRHRYFKLADADVAHALEALALVAERGTHDRRWAAAERAPLRYARCCYGHLAGQLGVALKEGLLARGVLEGCAEGFELTEAGHAWLRGLGIEVPPARRSQRLAYACIDWSERRDHLAGTLAVALLDAFVERGWLRRTPRDRALELTPRGRQHLLPLIGQPEAATRNTLESINPPPPAG